MNTLRIITAPEATELSPEPALAPSLAPAPEAPHRPGRSRWVVHVAIAIGVAVVAVSLAVAALVGVVFTSMRNSDAYQTSLAFVRSDSRVTAALGEPIENGLLPQGTIKRTGDFGKAELVFDLSGPRASGSAQVMSHRDGARWIVDSATFVVDGRTETLTP